MKLENAPAILGGTPVFKKRLPVGEPDIEVSDTLLSEFTNIIKSKQLTNGKKVEELEKAVASFLGVKNVVAVANGTLGLMLSLKAFNFKKCSIAIPDFTFSALPHAVHWCNHKIVPIDVDIETFNLSPERLLDALNPDIKAIISVHTNGNPAYVKELIEIAENHQIALIFDAAHAFGALYQDNKIGSFGEAEVFSTTPYKIFTTVEGGLVCSNSDSFAELVRCGRNYGSSGEFYKFPGLNARMSEFHAAVGLESLRELSMRVQNREKNALIYKRKLGEFPGISFQKIISGNRCSYLNFAIVVDESAFGINRDILAIALAKENIETKKYFYPPIHQLNCYPELKVYSDKLQNSTNLAHNVLVLPNSGKIIDKEIEKICLAFKRIYDHKDNVKSQVKKKKP